MSYLLIGAAVGSALLSASAAKQQGDAQANAATTEANAVGYQAALNKSLDEMNIKNIQSETNTKVQLIARAAGQMRGTQMAQQAASGVIVGDGSAGQMTDQTTQLAMQDTLATMYSGTNKINAMRANDDLQMEAAHNKSKALLTEAQAAEAAGNTKAGASLLQGAASAYSAGQNFFKPTVPVK